MTSKLALKASPRCMNFSLKLNIKFITKVYSTFEHKCTGCLSVKSTFENVISKVVTLYYICYWYPKLGIDNFYCDPNLNSQSKIVHISCQARKVKIPILAKIRPAKWFEFFQKFEPKNNNTLKKVI